MTEDLPLDHELKFASLGIPTILLEPFGKIPHRLFYGRFHGFERIAESDPVALTARRLSAPAANIGIATGAISGLIVLDGDTKRDGDPWGSLMEWEDMTGVHLPDDGPLVRTPSGGWHLYFRTDQRCPSPIGWLPDVDVRADGAQVVAPPSAIGTPADYVEYRLVRGDFSTIPTIPTEVVADIQQNGGRYSAIRGAWTGSNGARKDAQRHDIAALRAEGLRCGSRDSGFQSLSWSLTLRHYPHRDLIHRIAYEVWERTDQPRDDVYPWDRVERKLARAWEALEPRLCAEHAWPFLLGSGNG